MRNLSVCFIAAVVAVISYSCARAEEGEVYRYIGGEKLLINFSPSSVGEIRDPQIVSDDGLISLPTGTTVNIKGKTNPEARELLARKMEQETSAKKVEVKILMLEQPPRKIQIAGAVLSPRSVTLTPGVQLSLLAAIQEAGGTTTDADLTRVNLVRTEADGKRASQVIDITKLALPGSADLGPRLLAGDVILVPRGERYTFNGEFNKVGLIAFGDFHLESGERPLLARAIAGIGGLKSTADIKNLKILRLRPDGSREVIKPYEGGVEKDVALVNGDIVDAPAKAEKVASSVPSVSIIGKVRGPGIYPLGENGLKLSKLILIAGGFTEFAKKNKVILNRPSNPGCLKEIDMEAVLEKGMWDQDVELQDGDVVRVKERAF